MVAETPWLLSLSKHCLKLSGNIMLHILKVAWFTFFQASLSTLLALIIGLPAAFFCARRKFPGRKLLLSLSVVPFCVPSLIIALGYVTFLGLNGSLNQFLMFIFGLKEPPVRILYSFAGLIIAHGFYNFALIMKTVAAAWEQLPAEQSESARLLGASEARIFRTVTIYQLMPAIASSSLLVFIYCFLSFIMVLLFGGIGNSTLEVEIYKAARAVLDFRQAAVLAIVETSILCVITILYCMLENKASRIKGLSVNKIYPEKMKDWKEKICFGLLILVILIFFIAPLAGIGVNAFTSSKKGTGITLLTFKRVIGMRSFWPSFISTVKTGACTGLLCTVIGFAYSCLLRFYEQKKWKRSVVLNVIPMLPMSVSSVVVGVFIIQMVRRGNIWCLILAQTSLTWPMAYRQIYPHMVKISRDTLDAALLLSKNPLQTIFRVVFPLTAKGILSAFGFCFAISAGDTTLPLVLAIPKYECLSLFTYRLAGAYRFNEACAAGLCLGVLCALVFALSSRKRH